MQVPCAGARALQQLRRRLMFGGRRHMFRFSAGFGSLHYLPALHGASTGVDR